MTDIFKSFLKYLKQNIHGQKALVTPDILQFAFSQQVEGFFVDSLCAQDKSAIVRHYSYQAIKNRKIYDLIKLLEKSGIDALIMKGISVARFYPDACLRRSTDTDILVKKNDLKKISSLLKDMGYTVYKMRKEDHHMRAVHPHTGIVEFHYRLYDEIFDELWFDNYNYMSEDYHCFTYDGLKYKTFGITDGFLFIFFHFVKHYILEFVNVKWILDILFYAEKNSSEINWQRVYQVVESLGFATLLNSVLGVGVQYLGFKNDFVPDLDYSPEKAELFMSDVEFCSFTKNKEKLSGFFHALNIEANKKQDYKKYITKYNKLGKFNTCFARLEYLQKEYKFLIKYPFLLPFVWIYRVFRALCNLILGKRKMTDYNSVIPKENDALQKRMSVMKELEII